MKNQRRRGLEWGGVLRMDDEETPVYGAHSLRHTFATMAAMAMAMAGVKPAYLALMLGDNITTIQKYYVHVGFGMALADGFETIPKMIEAKSVEDPARAQTPPPCRADDLPLSAVRQVLVLIKQGQARHCHRQAAAEATGHPVTKNRRFSGDERLRIMEEARQPKASVTETCRRHRIAHRGSPQLRENVEEHGVPSPAPSNCRNSRGPASLH